MSSGSVTRLARQPAQHSDSLAWRLLNHYVTTLRNHGPQLLLSRKSHAFKLLPPAPRATSTISFWKGVGTQLTLGCGDDIQLWQMKALWRKYETVLSRRPYLVQATTSAVLWGAGDLLAQKVVEKRRELDQRRLLLHAGFGGGFSGPVGHAWYAGLDLAACRYLKPGTPAFIAAKVLADTFILGPLHVLAFYAYGSYVIDKVGWEEFKSKVSHDFLATWAAELVFWPAFQTVNFIKTPVEHQLLAVNMMAVLDASFLSWARSQEDCLGAAMPGHGDPTDTDFYIRAGLSSHGRLRTRQTGNGLLGNEILLNLAERRAAHAVGSSQRSTGGQKSSQRSGS